MSYQQKPFARKLREFKHLSKKVNNLLATGEFEQLPEESRDKLTAKLKHLYNRLSNIYAPGALKKVLAGAAIVIGLSLPNSLQAQQFAPPKANQFGIQFLNFDFTRAGGFAFVDLDDDGDMDMWAVETKADTSGTIYTVHFYFENTGSPSNPSFAAPVANPFGVDDSLPFSHKVSFVDIDADGDQDLFTIDSLSNANSEAFEPLFYENIGSPGNPSFANPVASPFGVDLTNYRLYNYVGSRYAFCDIDDDGDYDMFSGIYYYVTPTDSGYSTAVYFENTGTPTNPDFSSTPVIDPFGMDTSYYVNNIAYGDIDEDGDQDLLTRVYYDYSNSDFVFFENTGTSSNPSFGSSQQNPFGLQDSSLSLIFDLVDIDNDGDLDVMGGTYSYDPANPYSAALQVTFYENISQGSDDTTSVANRSAFLSSLKVMPNPATDRAQIHYNLPQTQNIRMELMTVDGQTVWSVRKGRQSKGSHQHHLNTEGLSSGIYLLEMRAGATVQTRKVVVE